MTDPLAPLAWLAVPVVLLVLSMPAGGSSRLR